MRTDALLKVAIFLFLAILAQLGQAGPILESTNDLTALKMLRNYMERYGEPDGDVGYVVLDDMRSNKRGMGPRPLRFG
ncbi:unnamed protein product [Bursaphelenchus xylophilus]|uniref:(pine wood nematode) hypothetical protein n=1 Tax=Bursaphelenchus xylophilus TaxID=6326 RepID=A0A1I7RT41_BURXY|nr:unnamed protein product [Bursaphelenchus xylophilus]CAG9122628.1 unnamed protein product [Bursaphelenchus xylophilus]